MDSAKRRNLQGRPWVGVKFTCCNVYTRIYRNRTNSAYEGRCPRCMKAVRLAIGRCGSTARFFNAG